ncbi:hypothetical protein K488DRAFT_67894 [Vararia minispora EC-137]|uniref:Uncharacterized protein n=1 Tax=Vararia minispora EC-137 TaxID=1314806 RepID=A0ACB8QY10_9AGAM|nr:hypothetical protein K488DRAFT_67894 [Vararia minispora EC-137]
MSPATVQPANIRETAQHKPDQTLTFGVSLAKSLSRDSSSSLSTGTGTMVAAEDGSRGWFGRSERSGSRGREVRSSGRGGAGNMRQSSAEGTPPRVGGPDDFSVTRGREPLPATARTSKSVSTGRGGAGNIREGRGVEPDEGKNIVNTSEAEHERRLIREHESSRVMGAYPSGRGGAGNIQRQPIPQKFTA